MKKKNLMLRFSITFLVVLIPLMTVSLIITQNMLDKIYREEKRKFHSQSDKVIEFMNNGFWEYKKKAVGLLENYEFSFGSEDGRTYAIWGDVKYLKRVKLFDSSMTELMVCHDGKNYTSEGLISSLHYFSNTLNCKEDSIEEGLACMEKKEDAVQVLLTKANKGYLMYHYPIGREGEGELRSVQIIRSFEDIAAELEKCVQSNHVWIQFLFGEREIWFYKDENGCRYVPERPESEERKEQDLFTIGGKSYSDIEIYLKCDIREQMEEYNQFRNLNLVWLILGLFLSVLMSLGLSASRVRQVKVLLDNLTSRKSRRNVRRKIIQSEYDEIQQLMNESIERTDTMRSRMAAGRQIIFQQVAMLIFNGLLKDRNEIQTILKICGSELFEEYFYLCGIEFEDSQGLEQFERLCQGDLHCRVEEMKGNQLVLLCEISCTDREIRRKVTDKLKCLLEEMNLAFGCIVLSQIYNQLGMANYAYLEVVDMLKKCSGKETGILAWEDFSKGKDQAEIPDSPDYYGSFLTCLEENEIGKAQKVLKRLLQKSRKKDGIQQAKHLRYRVQAAVLDALAGQDSLEKRDQLMQQMRQADTEDETAFEECALSVLEEWDRQDNVRFDEILQYIDQNFASYDLSLEIISEYAGLSKPQMSKLFKAQTGIGYIDYVTKLRMERAKTLLEQSSLSVKEIFVSVGYIDIINASRKFKTYYGITPTVYRLQTEDRMKGAGEKEDSEDGSRE